MHTTVLYTREVRNSAGADMHTGLQMLLYDVPYLTLLMERLGKQLPNYLLQQFLHYFILFKILALTIYLEIHQNRSAWLPNSITLRGLG